MKKILIVEDQPDVQNLLTVALHEKNYQLFHALNAADGLALARQETPDLLLLDIMMPGAMDGLGLLKVLKQEPETAGIKVIVLSARAQHHDQNAAMDEGADHYITKPFRLSYLKTCIEAAMESPSETST